jgi:hypothetical protein
LRSGESSVEEARAGKKLFGFCDEAPYELVCHLYIKRKNPVSTAKRRER